MSLLLRLEKWLEDGIERIFGPRESVQPIEIARRMVRAMEDQQRISVRRTYVPNSFVVHVSKEDLAELESFTNTLAQDLANHVRAAAQRQAFAFPGPVTVRFESEIGLKRGETHIIAQFVEGEEEQSDFEVAPGETPEAELGVKSGDTGRYQPQAAAEVQTPNMESTQMYKAGRKPLGTVRISIEDGPDTGAEFSVRAPASIGRRQGCDVQLHDPKVSRLHARLEITPEGLVLVDADSTNGMRLNGRTVRRSPIGPGDIVELGATRLAIRSMGGE